MRGSGSVGFINRVELFDRFHREISEVSISATVAAAPFCAQMLRNTESVMPAIGASKTLLRKVKFPIFKGFSKARLLVEIEFIGDNFAARIKHFQTRPYWLVRLH